ncbi:amidohydrolase family protein [Yinghuangia sp. ASG 101]|uniref:amidohydrolase n=1 Tax=Yinghuangia sp. ASG 101 TaxID=2896848 RepID=UPI001E573CF5|nr:amidohydrolase family protein [Yinghuangia sp. ASG 101]UGQ12253.1 amidohydrolase family protein [Yinghuangia sp. ASG 101]
MTVILLRNGNVHSPADPFATAMVVEDGTVAWIGAEGAAEAHVSAADRVLDLDGALVAPAFVDSHVHLTATGLALTGLDLGGRAPGGRGTDRIARFAGTLAADAVVLGQGWEDESFAGGPPDVAELDRAAGGRPAYISRVDVHSALASSALRARVPGLAAMAGYDATGPLTGAAHHAVRTAAFAALTPVQRADAQRAARARAASVGIGTLVECAGPDIAGEADLALLRATAEEPGPDVVAYWGEAVDTAEQARALVTRLGVHGLAGDLFADGSIGSHTACLHAAYDDRPTARGVAHLTPEQVAAHVLACTEAGVQAGFHAIGDAAVDAVVAGARAAADRFGAGAVRALRHRVEHAELISADAVAAFAELGLFASVQPAFDAAWGGLDGMYVRRLGKERAARMNPFAELNRAGVPLAFGSDAPVTPLDPWGTVRAAAFHRTEEQRISVRAAFTAHTRGGHRALGRDDEGVLVPGAPATYAVWRTGELTVQAPDRRVSAWSTDPSSGTPGLPDVTPGGELPVCVRTVVRGTTVYEAPDGA